METLKEQQSQSDDTCADKTTENPNSKVQKARQKKHGHKRKAVKSQDSEQESDFVESSVEVLTDEKENLKSGNSTKRRKTVKSKSPPDLDCEVQLNSSVEIIEEVSGEKLSSASPLITADNSSGNKKIY